MGGPQFYLSSVLPVLVRGWIAAAKAVGRTGVRLDFDGNAILRRANVDVAGAVGLQWSAGAVVIPCDVDITSAAAEIRAVGQQHKRMAQH